jgi:hypothetical protein
MKLKLVLCAALCVVLTIASCRSEKKTPPQTHLGGCVLIAPAAQPPAELYQESGIVPTDDYKPFTKKLSVYGITLIARDDIQDGFMRQVAETVKDMFPRSETVDAGLQQEVLRSLYRYRTVIPLFKGEEHEFTAADKKDWELTRSRNSVCDIIMEGVPGQVNEVVEHILHHVSDVGLQYALPDDWGLSKASRAYRAMQEAIERKHYVIEQYNEEIGEEEKTRILIQEFAYWVIFTGWDLYETYGPPAEWKGIRNPRDLKEKLPLSYALFEETIPKVMAPPGRAALEAISRYEPPK